MVSITFYFTHRGNTLEPSIDHKWSEGVMKDALDRHYRGFSSRIPPRAYIESIDGQHCLVWTETGEWRPAWRAL